MVNRIGAVVAAVTVCGLVTLEAGAELREVGKGVFVEDFEHGGAEEFAPDAKQARNKATLPTILRVDTDGGCKALHFKGTFHSRGYLDGRTFKDFALTARLRKAGGNYAGLVVRDHWRVYLQMKCFLSLNSDAPGLSSRGELLKSAERYTGYRELKVVCAGPLLHAIVDGKEVFKYKIGPGEGRLGVYAHGNGEAFYDELRIDTNVSPEHVVLVEPVGRDGCLVFTPEEPVTLRFRVSDFSGTGQAVTLAPAVRSWAGKVVVQPDPREVRAPQDGNTVVAFELGRVPGGFYRVDLRATCGGKTVSDVDDLPLAVQQRGSGRFAAPAIPVGAYYKYFNKTSPLYRNTYAHAAARSLKDHHFNAVVAGPSFTRETIDIFQSYGIATIARGGFLDHPAVIATLADDEPKPDQIDALRKTYDDLANTTDKPVTTCMVGEGMGLGGAGDPVSIWSRLKPVLRCFRWYGVKKSYYGPLHDLKYKGCLPLSSVLRIAEASSDTPYWFVAPSLGKKVHEAYYHKPTPAQTRCLMHLPLAYGADGILFWAFQSHGSWPCFVEQDSLDANDGTYAAAAEEAAKIARYAELIRSLEHAGLDIRFPSPVVDAVPRKAARDEKLYVYAVNRDAGNAVATRLLLWADVWTLGDVRDVFADKALKVGRDEEGYWTIPLTLAPGEGKLLAVDAALRRKK